MKSIYLAYLTCGAFLLSGCIFKDVPRDLTYDEDAISQDATDEDIFDSDADDLGPCDPNVVKQCKNNGDCSYRETMTAVCVTVEDCSDLGKICTYKCDKTHHEDETRPTPNCDLSLLSPEHCGELNHKCGGGNSDEKYECWTVDDAQKCLPDSANDSWFEDNARNDAICISESDLPSDPLPPNCKYR